MYADDLQRCTYVRATNGAGVAVAAVDHRVAHNALADASGINAFANGVNAAEKLVADNARIFGKRVMPAVNVYVRTANAGAFYANADIAGLWFGHRTVFDNQLALFLNNYAFHVLLSVNYQFHSVPSSRRATGK